MSMAIEQPWDDEFIVTVQFLKPPYSSLMFLRISCICVSMISKSSGSRTSPNMVSTILAHFSSSGRCICLYPSTLKSTHDLLIIEYIIGFDNFQYKKSGFPAGFHNIKAGPTRLPEFTRDDLLCGNIRELRDEFRTFFIISCPDLALFEDILKLVAQVQT